MEVGTRAVMPWLLLLCLAAMGGILQVVAQDDFGFVSIDCGLPGETGFVDKKTNLYFSTDAAFIDAGVNGNISFQNKDPSAAKTWNTVRSFPNGNRNCYTIVSPESGLKYLIRGKFWYGNYDRRNLLPILFDLYVGVNFWTTVNISDADSIIVWEAIVFVPDNFVQVCLVNTGSGTPFINGLDLRPMKNTLYPYVNDTQGLVLVKRINFGPSDPSTIVRYPDDRQDRWWVTLTSVDWTELTTHLEVSNDNDPFNTPKAVTQTAITPINFGSNIEFSLDLPVSPSLRPLSYVSVMHFTELRPLTGNDSRQYDINVNGRPWQEAYTPTYLFSGVVYSGEPAKYGQYSVSVNALANSTLPPIMNAIELFFLISTTNLGTDARDASAITAIKKDYQVHKNWMGDPCYPYSLAWDGVDCTYVDFKHPIIRSVNLSFSGLSGVISPFFGNIKKLEHLDLSNNNLIGSIPDELSMLPSLSFVDLSNNHLNGSIPSGLLKRIQDGSLYLRYDNNPDLCTSSPGHHGEGDPGPRSKRVIIIVVVVIVVVVIVLSVGILLFVLQRRKKQELILNDGLITPSSKMTEMGSSTSNNVGYMNNTVKLENRRFTYKELEMITKNFGQVLGQGGFGCVYHGFLENGIQVAVKLRSHSSDQGVKEFLVEAQVLTRIHHKNLVTMIGYCKEGDRMALVYEYMPEGNLQEHIAGKDKNGRYLTWRQRLRIAHESSQGIEYLHKGCNPPLIHRDVKATNILLNTSLEAKIADFGMSKAFNVNSNAHASTFTLVGTPGYVDPEYQSTMQPSIRSDVFSFGVVLLELITGKPAIVRDPEPSTLIRWAHQRLSRGDIEAVVDTRLQGDYDVNSVWKAAEIALKCTEQESIQRPTITEVVVQLQECLELEEDRIGFETTGESYSGSNNRFEMDQKSYKRAPTMDVGPAAR